MTVLENEHEQARCNNFYFILLNVRKMARTLNLKCNFTKGFFACDRPKDAIQLVLKIKTKLGKHTLTEDHKRWMEKYRPWERHAKDSEGSSRRRLDSFSPKKVNDSSATSDSGPWLPTPTEFQYRPKIFNDPRNVSSDKENTPPLESVTTLTFSNLNIMEDKFCNRTETLLGKETKWEAHVAQQIPLPRSSSPYPDDRPGALEQLEPETDNDIDVMDYMERPVNDRRPPKPKKDVALVSRFKTIVPHLRLALTILQWSLPQNQ